MYDSIRNRSNNTNITVSFRLNYSNNYSKYSSPTASPFSTNIKHTGIFDNYSFTNTIKFSLQDGLPPEKLHQKTSSTLGHICVTQYELCSNTRPTDLTNIINVVCCLLPRNIHITHNNFWGYSKSQRIPCWQEIEYFCTPCTLRAFAHCSFLLTSYREFQHIRDT